MLRAVRPCLAKTGGKLIVLSSRYSQSGALWDLRRRHFGRDDSTTLVWHAGAPAMNPTLPRDYLVRMEADDPEAYRSEVLGEFRAGISTFLDLESISACVVTGRRELAPVAGARYAAHVDPSGGGKDAFTLAIAHRDHERVIVDCIRAWHSKNPSRARSRNAPTSCAATAWRRCEVIATRPSGSARRFASGESDTSGARWTARRSTSSSCR
jgi:hypothetical protein